MRIGPLAAADAQSVTLPARLPSTPEQILGNVRAVLAHDGRGRDALLAAGRGSRHAGTGRGEYFATILAGRGMGQTRCVVARQGATYLLDRPWRVPRSPAP